MSGPALRIGTSGYQYDHWKGRFYPNDLPTSRWFEHYAAVFDTVEINNTFYQLPDAHVFDDWARRAPANFLYALKFSRYGSHLKHLKDPPRSLDTFVPRARRLGEYLGPILIQLPPHWRIDLPRLDAFLAAAPADLRWAVEFRNPTWLTDSTFELLQRHRTALCIHDMLADHPRLLTTDWTYLRYHGPGPWGCYTPQALTAQAQYVAGLLDAGHDVYAYFNNDAEGFAIDNALKLRQYAQHARTKAT